jgi:NAD(P)-dependent dehydrogenase (short-subunit alcohol dehydrogenase family)
MSGRGVCLIIGAGPGLGAGVARAFAREGYDLVLTRRPRNLEALAPLVAEIEALGVRAFARGVDARSEEETIALIEEIERDIGPLEILVFNIGANVRFDILETTTRVFTKVWEMACLAGFLAGREAARVMLPRGRGTILFTGATASVRGGDGYSAFSAAKHGLRAVAQSMARELGPQGVHVAHVIVDGAIEGEFSRGNIPDFDQRLAEDRILKPDAIAPTFVAIHQQSRSAWTHEADVRPWAETW